MYSKSTKSKWVLVICLLAGIALGGALGEYLSGFDYLKWLSFGQSFGFTEPVALDIGILVLKFAILLKINIAAIIGIIISIFVYKKL